MGWGVERVVEVGAVVDVGAGLDVDEELEDVEDDDFEVDEEDVEGELDVGEIVLVVSCTGPSSTGGGSAGAAATRKPRKTSNGTHNIAPRSMPSRPMRHRLMSVLRCCGQDWSSRRSLDRFGRLSRSYEGGMSRA